MPAAAVIAAIGTALGVVGTAVGPILRGRKKDKDDNRSYNAALTQQLQTGAPVSLASNPGDKPGMEFLEKNKTAILILLSALSVFFIFTQTIRK